jgi:predicted dehydrogenase
MEPLRLGVIGVGLMGEGHVASNQRNALGKIVAICNRGKERLDHVQQEYGIPAAYQDYNEMFAKEKLDGVIIATPDGAHVGPAKAAAAAGVHILLEKPIATNLPEAEAVVAACREAGVKLQVGFVLRFTTPYLVLRQQILAGEVGRPTMVYASRCVAKREAKRIGVHRDVLQAVSIHDIDTMLWNFGTDVESVYAVKGGDVLKDLLNTPDYYWTTLNYRNGLKGVSLGHWAMPDTFPLFVSCEMLVTGTDGSAQLRLSGQDMNVISDKSYTCPDTVFAFNLAGGSQAFREEGEQFCRCIIDDVEPLVTGRDGLNALKVCLAAEESAETGRPVPVSLE